MGIVKRSLRRLLNWVHNDEADKMVNDAVPIGYTSTRKGTHGGPFEDASGTTFVLYNTKNGSKIIQMIRYDQLTDRRETALYTINNEDNFGEEFGQIILRESLSR